MSKVTIDGALLERLQVLREPVEFVDAEGNLLGTFDPVPQPPYDPGLIPPMEPEEIRRRLANPRRRTWDEIRRDLERAQ